MLALQAGKLLHIRASRRGTETPDAGKSDADGYIIAAIFALLAFLTGLTFSIALDRFDTRRGLVAEEANAISTAYLRASLFDEPHRAQLQTLLHTYARSRIAPEGLWNKQMDAKVENARALRDRLWDATHAAVYPVRETELASYFVEAMNETLNVGIRRELAGRAHVPTRILNILLLYLVAASVVLGYLVAEESRGRRQAAMILVALFAVSMLLILDIDRPHSGTVNVPQRALEELIAMLDRDAARRNAAPITRTPR
ncbi:hypothetical protein [Sphingomonas cavernae]|uniref:bestrophin-like domain n=1 Tax=Sphingomonas cavernae TaxID=2320861 RepID=UPI0016023088|nr:hypothetical protein [Sphingomonas cavernae]